MATPYSQNVNLIQDGESVEAKTPNRPLSQLAQRTDANNEKISNALIGQTTMDYEAAVLSTTSVCMAVYRDNTGLFRPTLATTTTADDNATIIPDDSAYAWGMIQKKHTNQNANVVLNGYFIAREDDLIAVIEEGAIDTGLFFLSQTAAGKVTKTRPPLGFGICRIVGSVGADTDGEPLYEVYVNPEWTDPFEGHIHYHVRMVNTVSTAGSGEWVSGVGDGPVGTQYYYDYTNDSNLSDIWPPIPIGAVHIDRDGVAADVYGEIDLVINSDGIFWMDSVTDPTDYDYIDFYFTKMTFKVGSAMVTSLAPADTSIVITDANGKAATIGDLKVSANFAVTNDTADAITGLSFKTLSGLNLGKGPIIEGLRTTTPNYVSITSDETFISAGNTYSKGLVTLSVSDPSGQREGPVEFTSLDNTELETKSGISYIEFENGQAGSITGKFRVPSTGLPSALNLTISLIVWGFAAGTTPNIPLTYWKFSPSAVGQSQASPSFTTATAITGAVIDAGDMVELQSDDIEISAGDIIVFTLSRTASDGYAGNYGIVDQRWNVTPRS